MVKFCLFCPFHCVLFWFYAAAYNPNMNIRFVAVVLVKNVLFLIIIQTDNHKCSKSQVLQGLNCSIVQLHLVQCEALVRVVKYPPTCSWLLVWHHGLQHWWSQTNTICTGYFILKIKLSIYRSCVWLLVWLELHCSKIDSTAVFKNIHSFTHSLTHYRLYSFYYIVNYLGNDQMRFLTLHRNFSNINVSVDAPDIRAAQAARPASWKQTEHTGVAHSVEMYGDCIDVAS